MSQVVDKCFLFSFSEVLLDDLSRVIFLNRSLHLIETDAFDSQIFNIHIKSSKFLKRIHIDIQLLCGECLYGRLYKLPTLTDTDKQRFHGITNIYLNQDVMTSTTNLSTNHNRAARHRKIPYTHPSKMSKIEFDYKEQ